MEKKGKTVADIILKPGICPSIAPYKPALQLVAEDGELLQESSSIEEVLVGEAELEDAVIDGIEGDEVQRDIMGEMIIIARLMVTGGEELEEARMTRADNGLLKAAIIEAAVAARKAKKNDVLTEDIIKALRNQPAINKKTGERIEEMANAMDLFLDGFAGELFNRPGEDLPDADFIRIEMGALAAGNDNTNDKLSVAYISIINQVIDRAQRTQRDGRPTINLTDEAHVITTNPLMANYLVVVSKLLGRRLGLWMWMATQNMEDFTGASSKMLAMFEWWECLFVDQGELAHIEKHRSLSKDQKDMLLCTRKERKKYTEGVLMSETVQGLFRVIHPGLTLALAGTEKEEKRERMKIMKKHDVDEVRAAEIIGETISKSRLQA